MERVVEVPVVHEVPTRCLTRDDVRVDDLTPIPPPSIDDAGRLCWSADVGVDLFANIKTLLTRLRDAGTKCVAP